MIPENPARKPERRVDAELVLDARFRPEFNQSSVAPRVDDFVIRSRWGTSLRTTPGAVENGPKSHPSPVTDESFADGHVNDT